MGGTAHAGAAGRCHSCSSVPGTALPGAALAGGTPRMRHKPRCRSTAEVIGRGGGRGRAPKGWSPEGCSSGRAGSAPRWWWHHLPSPSVPGRAVLCWGLALRPPRSGAVRKRMLRSHRPTEHSGPAGAEGSTGVPQPLHGATCCRSSWPRGPRAVAAGAAGAGPGVRALSRGSAVTLFPAR